MKKNKEEEIKIRKSIVTEEERNDTDILADIDFSEIDRLDPSLSIFLYY